MRPAAWSLAGVAAAVALAGTLRLAAPEPTGWAALELSGGVLPRTLTQVPDGVLVGTQSPAPPGDGAPPPARVTASFPPPPGAPSLVLLSDGGDRRPLPVRGSSPYAPYATWTSIDVGRDGSLVGIGGARGGSHANVRWTVWRGSLTSGLTEDEVNFFLFGGYDAGDLAAAATSRDGPFVTGGWKSARAGMDAVVYRPSPTEGWSRDPVAGTAMESSAAVMHTATGARALGAQALLVGSTLRNDGSRPALLATVWSAPTPAGPWRAETLDADGSDARADAISCDEDRCVIVGRVGEHLALWRGAPGKWTRDTSVPRVPADAIGGEPAVLAVRGDEVVAAVAVAKDSSAWVAHARGGRWRVAATPGGRLRTVALLGPSVLVVTGEDDAARLWRR